MNFTDELGVQNSVQHEECRYGNTVIRVPQELCEKEDLLLGVLNLETCDKVLTKDHWAHLTKFLPAFPENDDSEKQVTIRKLLSGENFNFGNPVVQFHKKLRDGEFSSSMQEMTSIMHKAKLKDYRFQQQQYYFKLLQEVLMSRKKLLEAAMKLPPDQAVKMDRLQPTITNNVIDQHTKKRYFRELQEVREEVCELVTSSEDENYPDGSPPKLTKKQKKQMFHYEAALSPDMTRISSTMSPKHGLNNWFSTFEVNEEYYRDMLVRHKKRRHDKDDDPDLDVSSITLQDVVTRTSMIKRAISRSTTEIPGNKKKAKDKVEKKKKKSKPSTNASITSTNDEFKHVDNDKVKLKVEEDRVEVDSNAFPPYYSSVVTDETHSSYFALIRDIICKSADQRISAGKLEEEVRLWQESPFAPLNEWYGQQASWVEQVVSTLKFLAGDFAGVQSDSFVPFIDYKEKIQMWQWIGVGRDSDENMAALNLQWMQSKDETTALDAMDTSTGSPPPARSVTEWLVRPTSEEERSIYREQERRRYENPHKAFTFCMHDYESVVGPVKGVYGKDGTVNKAREHSLLVSDRPPFVTILSLVRDAASRLPNGEGTRADICELLKDSQYLAVTADSQVHTVVSGALDRLHYEKDPCVKYDVNRKLWIYLHRNRTEEEFERIHQQQAAAAKAKKSVHKPKVPRTNKNKDATRLAIPQGPVESNSVTEIMTSATLAAATSVPTQRFPGNMCRIQTNSPKISLAAAKPRIALSASPKAPQIVSQATKPTRPAISSLVDAQVTTTTTGPFILPQSHAGSRPSSTGSSQSLPSPKAVIANVNAAQFVSVSQVQIAGPGTAISPKTISSPSQHPKTVSNLLSQQQALQQMVAKQQQHLKQTLISSATTTPTTVKLMATTAGAHTTNQILQSPIGQPSLQGLQTIMIKQEPNAVATTANNMKTAMPACTKPVVARIISNPQVVSMGNLIASTITAAQKPQLPGATTIKIQGSNLMQRAGAGTVKNAGSAMNLIQTSVASATGLPRLAVVTQGPTGSVMPVTCNTGISCCSQPKFVATASGHLGVMTNQQGQMGASKPTFLTTARGMKILSASTSGMNLAQLGAKPSGVVVSTKPSTTTSSNVILTASVQTTPTVVIASQGALKPAQTVVMATTNTAQTVVMAAQSGMRPIAAVTPVTMKALQGVKVIPVSQAQTAKNKSQPVFARIITPPTGLTLQSGALGPPQQGISVIQSMTALSAGTSTPLRPLGTPNNPLTATPTTIIRLQTPSGEGNEMKDK